MANTTHLWNLGIKHEYYGNSYYPGLNVVATPETQKLFARRSIRFISLGAGRWNLSAFGQMAGNDDDIYKFYVQLPDRYFFYYTNLSGLKPGKAIHIQTDSSTPVINISGDLQMEDSTPGTILTIALSLKGRNSDDETVNTEIFFYSPKVYWEYIFLYKDDTNNRIIGIEDMDEVIHFDTLEETVFYDKPGIGFRSASHILLQRNPQHRLRLVERTRGIRRELIKSLPPPEVADFLDTRPDVVRKVMYI